MAAPGPFHFFAKNANKFDWSNSSLLAASALRMGLYTNTPTAWNPNITATGWGALADITAVEVGAGLGYTVYTLSLTVAADAANDGFKISTGNPTWTATGAGIVARAAVLYYLGSLWSVTSPLIGYFLLDSTPADVTTSAGNILQINCPSDGWGKITSS